MYIGYFSKRMGTFFTTLAKVFPLLLCCGLFTAGTAGAAEPMLPKVYTEQVDIGGWLMSEKLDGVRGYWDGQQLFSKSGRLLNPPLDFIANLPDFPVEGELWGGRGTFEQTVAIVLRKQAHEGWQQLKFAIFDVPNASGGFTQRIKIAQDWFIAHPSRYAFVISQTPVDDNDHLQHELRQIEHLGGEGLIVRNADALYASGRSSEVLKVKSFRDAEATVVAHYPGKGRHAGRLGSLLVKLDSGILFKIGAGFSDKERENPPAVGEIITFKFYGKYQSGVPKFPSFLRLRQDTML